MCGFADTRARLRVRPAATVWNEIVTVDDDGRPWPAPSPDEGWWQGEPATEQPDDTPAKIAVKPRPRPEPARPTEEIPPFWPAPAPGAAQPAEPGPVAAPPPGDELWPTPQMRVGLPHAVRRGRRAAPRRRVARRRVRTPRRPLVGLAVLLVLAPLAAFAAWASADPLWLAVGHGRSGTATVTACAGHGLTRRCTATFAGGRFTATRVAAVGLPKDARRPGAKVPATMVSPRGRIAYAGARAALHLRWASGLVLVLLCGLGIAWGTGASRLPGRRARVGGYLTSLAAPLLLLAGIVAASW